MGPKRTFSLLGLTVGKHRSLAEPSLPLHTRSPALSSLSLFLGGSIWFSFFFEGINLNGPLNSISGLHVFVPCQWWWSVGSCALNMSRLWCAPRGQEASGFWEFGGSTWLFREDILSEPQH